MKDFKWNRAHSDLCMLIRLEASRFLHFDHADVYVHVQINRARGFTVILLLYNVHVHVSKNSMHTN